MRNIKKGKEPKSLTEYRLQSDACYDDYREKDDLRKSLVTEQHGLCCYCMSRIVSNDRQMKIDHWQCQENYSDRQLDYSNLHGACIGGEGKPPRQQHCDTLKANSTLHFCPSDPNFHVENLISFLGDGTIKSSERFIDSDLNSILNLNLGWLKSNRKATLDIFKNSFDKGIRINPDKELPKWDGSQTGELPEYAQVIVHYLRKKKRRQGVAK